MDDVEQIWRILESSKQFGAMRRVSEDSTADFFCGLDSLGRRGLVLVSSAEPPATPTFAAVEIISSRRTDGNWAFSVWLRDGALSVVFSKFCESLIETVSSYASDGRAAGMLSFIMRSQELLEESAGTLLSIQKLRGLIGELLALRSCLSNYTLAEAITAWTGPFRTPQDFSFPGLFIEAKAVVPSATTVKISSFDQLEPFTDSKLVLAVFVLAEVPSTSATTDQISLASVVSELRELLKSDPILDNSFLQKLAAAGYRDDPYYGLRRFRTESILYFSVVDGFPLINRAQVSAGVVDGIYHISLASCLPFRQESMFAR